VSKRTRKKRGRGRPTKLDAELQARIVGHLRGGGYVETAAAACGVSKVTVYAWLRQGNEEERGPHRDFLNAVEEALAEAEHRDLARVGRAAGRNWRAAAWRLERRHPRRWGARVRVTVEEELTGFLDHLERVLDPTVYEQVLTAAEAWDGEVGPAAAEE
jgi:transposase